MSVIANGHHGPAKTQVSYRFGGVIGGLTSLRSYMPGPAKPDAAKQSGPAYTTPSEFESPRRSDCLQVIRFPASRRHHHELQRRHQRRPIQSLGGNSLAQAMPQTPLAGGATDTAQAASGLISTA